MSRPMAKDRGPVTSSTASLMPGFAVIWLKISGVLTSTRSVRSSRAVRRTASQRLKASRIRNSTPSGIS